MKRTKRTMFAALILFVAVAMTACGGGGGGGSDAAAPVPIPLINSSSIGVVTGLGSVIVNGVTFSTTGATVTIDDNPSAADQLKVGMVVKVRGTSDDAARTGTAVTVEARDALEGTISTVGANSIVVMGQNVQIEDNVTRLNDDDTVKTFAAANFFVGDKVEVHGFPDDQGGLSATRVVKKATNEFEIKGFITTISGTSFGLSPTVGGTPTLTVNFTTALPTGAAAGSFVQVKSGAAPAGTPPVITATTVKLEDAIGTAGDKIRLEGMVTSGTVDSFVINGRQVLTNAATVFEGGLKTDFLLGIKVQAEGPLDANGAIVATKISFKGNIRIEADVTAFTAGSSVTVLGKQVAINQYTHIDNGPVVVGSHVEVRAFADRDGNPIATRIIVRNPDIRAFLQAPVTAVDGTAGTMTILGNAVTTNASTEFRTSSDIADAAVAASVFFAQVKPNITVVKVRWLTGVPTLAADQAEIEVSKTLLSSNNAASQGVVTALGSVFVNGIRFHTGSAAVMVNGAPATEANLKPGMVVKVRGTIDDATRTGTAAMVEAVRAVEGTIEAVGANTITVMGQVVRIEDNVTRLNDDDLQKVFADAAFAVGNVVEVNGFVDDNGGIRATRVAKKASGGFQVKGFVVSIGAGSLGLSLTPGGAATLTVNFAGTLPAGIVVGSIIEAKSAAAPVGGAITATLIKLDDNIGVGGEKAKVEGIVMAGGTVASFSINGRGVVTNAATLFDGGLPADFAAGIRLEAEGLLDANGIIVASKISFRNNIRIEADATAITATRVTLNVGTTVAVNQFTRVDAGIVAPRHVEVRAFLDRNNNLIATRVIDRGVANNNNRIELQGVVLNPADGNPGAMTILGKAVVTTDAATTFQLSGTAAQTTITRAAFFGQLKTGLTVVKVRWARIADFNNVPAVPVTQAEIEIGK